VIINDPENSHALADLAQRLTSQQKVQLIELVNANVPFSMYPDKWQQFLTASGVKAVSPDLLKYSPDQERDERGRFGSGSSTSGRAERHGHEAAAVAETLYSHASRIEPALTVAMKEMGAKYGLKLEGLAFRLKSQESLTRKIAAEAQIKGKDPAAIARDISDANRYTMIAEPSGYRAAAQSVIEDLRSRGYEARVKNYWQEGSNYKGVNVALVDHEGNKIELQFHTPESFALKENENHPLYEEYRQLTEGTPRAVELNNQMVANSARLETPPLLENFGEPKIGKSAIANKLQPGYDDRGGGL
jgi:hypothetical protein